MEEGKRYMIRYRLDGQRRDRTAVMDYIGSQSAHDRTTHFFSARPLAGTQSLPAEAIREANEVAKSTKIHMNRVVA